MKKAREALGRALDETYLTPPDGYEDGVEYADKLIRKLSEAGFVIVPKDPTEGMLTDIKRAISDNMDDDYGRPPVMFPARASALAAYRAMLSSAQGGGE